MKCRPLHESGDVYLFSWGWGVEFECLGCWPCRTAPAASSLLEMRSQLTPCPKILYSWQVLAVCSLIGCYCLNWFLWSELRQAYLKKVQSSEFVVVQSSLVLWLNQFSVWLCFRQCARQSALPCLPSKRPRWTSTASRMISVHFLSQHLTQPLSHQRLNLPLHCGLPAVFLSIAACSS